MINVLIISEKTNNNIFTLCFNIKKKIKCNITIFTKDTGLNKWIKNKPDFEICDKVLHNIINYNKFHIILKDINYDFNDLFQKLELENVHQLEYISSGKFVYNSNIVFNKYFIDSSLNIQSKHKKINIKKLKIDKAKNIKLNVILYGFLNNSKQYDIKTKLRDLGKFDMKVYYNCPDILEEPITEIKKIKKNINYKYFNYLEEEKLYIKKLKSNNFLKNYINKLNIYHRTRFIRIYSMINSIKKSLDLVKEVKDEYYLITRYDMLKNRPELKFIYKSKNYIFCFRNKFYPSVEDRFIILDKNMILKLKNFYKDFDINFINLVKNNKIMAPNGILTGEFFFKHIFLKDYYFYQYKNFDITKNGWNKVKNSKNVIKYYKKLWFTPLKLSDEHF